MDGLDKVLDHVREFSEFSSQPLVLEFVKILQAIDLITVPVVWINPRMGRGLRPRFVTAWICASQPQIALESPKDYTWNAVGSYFQMEIYRDALRVIIARTMNMRITKDRAFQQQPI